MRVVIQRGGSSMRRSLVVSGFVAVVVLSVAAVALAGERCSIASVKGTWGYSETGTLYVPTSSGPVAVPYASVGSYTVDHWGKLSGARTSMRGGPTGAVKQTATIQGTATVNSDCTGELSIGLYDPATGALLNTVVKFVVYIEESTAAQSILTDIVLPDGVTHLTAVLVTEAKKVCP